MTEPESHNRRMLYGRRKGHRLSSRRQRLIDDLLPRLRLDLETSAPRSLAALFPAAVEDVWLEIGFGAGEHLAWQARQNPAIGFIGAEPFINGLANLLARIETDGIHNIRIYDGDVRAVLDWLPDAGLGRAFVLFPDPWPKKRHHKRRLLSPETLAALARVLRPESELRIATDSGEYARAILIAAARVDALEWHAAAARDWRERSSDWPATRYEEKAREDRRRSYYLRFRRR